MENRKIIRKKLIDLFICIFITSSLSGCDLFFSYNANNSHQSANANNSIFTNRATSVPIKTDNNLDIQHRKGMVFFQYDGQEGKKQQKLIDELKKRLAPIDITIVKNNIPINFNLQGHYKYILFTGSHGEFVNGIPIKFNGINANKLQKALDNTSFSADVIIFDTCFGSSFIPHFIKARTINPGGKIICSHGECQGYSQAIRDSNVGSSLSDVFNKLLRALDDLGSEYNSLSLYVHNISQPNSNEKYGTLYTRKYVNRGYAMDTARFLGITDSENEIQELEIFLKDKKINIVNIDKAELIKIFTNNLKDIIL